MLDENNEIAKNYLFDKYEGMNYDVIRAKINVEFDIDVKPYDLLEKMYNMVLNSPKGQKMFKGECLANDLGIHT